MFRDKTPQPPMRRIRWVLTHGISGYLPESGPDYFTELRTAEAAMREEVRAYIDALGGYDDGGARYRKGHDNRVEVERGGPLLTYITAGQGISRFVQVQDAEPNLYFDDLGDVYAKETTPEGRIAWVEVPQD